MLSSTTAPCKPDRDVIGKEAPVEAFRGKDPAALLEPDCVLLPIEEALTAALLEPEGLVNPKEIDPAPSVAPAPPVAAST